MDAAKYTPNDNVLSFHNVPRFGFSDNMAVLFTDDDSEREEYINGLIYFSIIVVLLCTLWMSILFMFKFMYGAQRVGCAAGGEAIHLSRLRQDGVRRWERRRRSERSWSVQNVFLMCCFGIPAFSAVVVNRGIDPLLQSLEEVSETAGVFKIKAHRGIDISQVLNAQFEDLEFYSEMNMTRLCPNYKSSPWAAEHSFFNTTANIQQSIQELGSFLGEGVDKFLDAMNQLVDASEGVMSGVDTIEQRQWMIRALLLTLNALTVFLAIGALLAKNQLNHLPMQKLLSFVLVPLFALTLIGFVVCTCFVATFAVVNADFCAGGEATSPIGTLREFSHLQGYDESTLMQQSIAYFSDRNCRGQSPLQFVTALNEDIYNTAQMVERALFNLRQNNDDPALIAAECGTDIRQLNATYIHVSHGLKSVSGNLRAAITSTTCPSIRPLLDDIQFGASCTDSINGATWLFSSLLAMVVLGLIMLTTRAAMYNPIIPQSKRRRREKEFHQYKGFMSARGYNTSEWLLEPDKTKILSDKGSSAIATTFTFETDESASMSTASRKTPDSLSSESSASQFFDEGSELGRSSSQNSNRTSPSALPPILEDKIIIDDIDYVDSKDDVSVYSIDSDDSSVHPPPSVISAIFSSNLTHLVNHLRRSPKNVDDASMTGSNIDGTEADAAAPSFASPVKVRQYQQKIASLFHVGDGRIEEETDLEKEWTPPEIDDPYTDDIDDPPTPQTNEDKKKKKQPKAPQKIMHAFPRTVFNA